MLILIWVFFYLKVLFRLDNVWENWSVCWRIVIQKCNCLIDGRECEKLQSAPFNVSYSSICASNEEHKEHKIQNCCNYGNNEILSLILQHACAADCTRLLEGKWRLVRVSDLSGLCDTDESQGQAHNDQSSGFIPSSLHSAVEKKKKASNRMLGDETENV